MILNTINNIRTGIKKKKLKIIIKFSKINYEFLVFLLNVGYIVGFEKSRKNDDLFLIVYLKYSIELLSTLNELANYEHLKLQTTKKLAAQKFMKFSIKYDWKRNKKINKYLIFR